jgi:hypothetical protein
MLSSASSERYQREAFCVRRAGGSITRNPVRPRKERERMLQGNVEEDNRRRLQESSRENFGMAEISNNEMKR